MLAETLGTLDAFDTLETPGGDSAHGDPARRGDPARADRPDPAGVLVVVRPEIIRHGLVSMLGRVEGVGAVRDCAAVATGVELLAEQSPDLLVCQAAEDAVAELVSAASAAGSRIVLLLKTVDLEGIDRATLLAANGFLLQDEVTLDRLREAVERSLRDEMSLPGRLARALVARGPATPRDDPADRPPGAPAVLLTVREHEVLGLLAQGLSNKQIGRRLGISEHGVKRHVTRLLAKLNSPNRTFAVARALSEGIIAPAE